MISVLQALGVEATTGHWEFTLGAQRVAELFGEHRSRRLLGHRFPRRQCARYRFRRTGVSIPFAIFEKGGIASP